jgi:hypothetical protein
MQADQMVENASFPAVRAEINLNLKALFTNNSGSLAPGVTEPHMDWVQETGASTATWYRRNSANNSWITVATVSGNTISFEGALPSQASQSGKFLTTNGTVASWATVTAGGRLLRAPQVLTTGTSYTAPANCVAVYIEAIGGGGGGGGRQNLDLGGGGGSGAYCAKYFTVTPFASYAYAIGAGGAGGSVGSPGGDGGTTTFTVGGTTISAGGGTGGSGGSSGNGGPGGSASNGDINAAGSGGAEGGTQTSRATGGSSFFGGGGAFNGAGSVGGGGGNGDDGGGAGGAGLIRIWEYS